MEWINNTIRISPEELREKERQKRIEQGIINDSDLIQGGEDAMGSSIDENSSREDGSSSENDIIDGDQIDDNLDNAEPENLEQSFLQLEAERRQTFQLLSQMLLKLKPVALVHSLLGGFISPGVIVFTVTILFLVIFTKIFGVCAFLIVFFFRPYSFFSSPMIDCLLFFLFSSSHIPQLLRALYALGIVVPLLGSLIAIEGNNVDHVTIWYDELCHELYSQTTHFSIFY